MVELNLHVLVVRNKVRRLRPTTDWRRDNGRIERCSTKGEKSKSDRVLEKIIIITMKDLFWLYCLLDPPYSSGVGICLCFTLDGSVKHLVWFSNEKTRYCRASSYCHARVLGWSGQ